MVLTMYLFDTQYTLYSFLLRFGQMIPSFVH